MAAEPSESDLLRWTLLHQLEAWRLAGLEFVPKPSAELATKLDALARTPSPASSTVSLPPPRGDRFVEQPAPVASRPAPSLETQEPAVAKRAASAAPRAVKFDGSKPSSEADRNKALDEVRRHVEVCKLCDELACTRTQTVFGVGAVKPRVVFFGEAPGADEDRQGEPFVGRAGQLLTKIIEACTFRREDVYILNVLKCRPPDNRTPTDEEAENCRPYFERQLEILQPEYIVCVGAVPTKALLKTTTSIGKLRQKFHDWNGVKVVATYHPAYLLRNPDAKKFVWDDMKMLLTDMGIELPKKS